MVDELKERIRKSADRRILFTAHSVRQMSRPDRMISSTEVRGVIAEGEVIEDYPSDPRGHGCLLLGKGARGRPVHVVCSPKHDYLAVITAYLPEPGEWDPGFRRRRKK